MNDECLFYCPDSHLPIKLNDEQYTQVHLLALQIQELLIDTKQPVYVVWAPNGTGDGIYFSIPYNTLLREVEEILVCFKHDKAGNVYYLSTQSFNNAKGKLNFEEPR